MSVVFSGTNQGSFISNGAAQVINLRSDIDWMYVYNTTQAAANQTTAVGVKYYWQRGFPNNSEWVTYKSNAANAANLEQYITTGGFSLVNSSISVPGAAYTVTGISNATPPVVSTGNTTGVSIGSVVRLYNITGAEQLGGLDFSVGAVTANTSFTLAYGPSIVTAAGGSPSAYRLIPYQPYMYPPTRVISDIQQATIAGYSASGTYAVITFTVQHAYTVGQKLRFVVPTVTSSAFGMPQLNGLFGTILAVGVADKNSYTNTVVVDINVSTFGSFAWPLTATPNFTPAQVVPVGENTSVANQYGVNPFEDSEINQAYIGMVLQGGAGYPGGATNDVMYWVAGKSFNV
jgi:hypothetical protein